MSTKEKIIHQVNNIENEAALVDILNLIDAETAFDKVYEVSPEQNAAIDAGLEDLKNGNVFSQQEAKVIVSQWMKNK